MLLNHEQQWPGALRGQRRRRFGSGFELPLSGVFAEFVLGHANSRSESDADVSRCQWLFLQRVEGQLLSGEHQAGGDAGVVRRAPAHGRDQQHLLSDAQGERARELGEVHARGFPVLDQSLAPHYPPGATEGGGRGGFGRFSLPEPGGTRPQARPGAVPAPAVHEERPAAAERISPPAARGTWRRVRVSQRELVRRRCLRRAQGGRRGAVPLGARRQRAAAPGADGSMGLRPASARNLLGRRSRAMGRQACGDGVARDLRVFHARADGACVRTDIDAACAVRDNARKRALRIGRSRAHNACGMAQGGSEMARRPELVTHPDLVKGDGRGAKWRGSLDADIIIANAPDPVFVSDLEGKILQANDAVSQLLGFRQDEVLEQSLSRFISPAETREFTAALREVVERGVTRNARLNPRSASGQVIPTTLNASALRNPDGRVIGAIGILRDMRELDKARDYAESLIKNAPDPVFVSDLEGKILQANDAVFELLGF